MNISPTPGNLFPKVVGPQSHSTRLSQPQHLISLTMCLHASQMPPLGWSPGILQVNAPAVNSAAPHQLCSSASISLPFEVPTKVRESPPQCPSNPPPLTSSPRCCTCLLTGRPALALLHPRPSFPKQLGDIYDFLPLSDVVALHHLQKEAQTPWPASKPRVVQ